MAFLLYKWLISLTLLASMPVSAHSIPEGKQEAIQDIYHPFYVSVTEITHNNQEKSLEISCKIFVDDLEGVLEKTYQKPVHLSDDKKQVENGSYIYDYIKKHLKIWVDGAVVKLNYVGYEKDSEAVFCYFEAPSISSVKKLAVENSVLYDFTNQEINIMHVTLHGKRQSYKLDFPNKNANFGF